MLTAVYIRVSTKKQNVDSQRDILLDYCKKNNWQYRTYIDKASGKDDTRLGLNHLLRDLRDGKYERLLFYKLDRMTRSFFYGVKIEKLFHELIKQGVKIVSLRDNIDLSSPSGRLQFRIMLGLSAYEYETLHERIRIGLKNRKERLNNHAEGRVK